MTTDTGAVAYATVLAEAESSVVTVKDPELRRVAFEKILATLLERRLSEQSPTRDTLKSQTSTRVMKGSVQLGSKPQSGPKGYVEELIRDDFFKEERTIAQVKTELATRGRHIALTSLSGPLQTLTQQRRLRRQKIMSNSKGTKTAYAYSNW